MSECEHPFNYEGRCIHCGTALPPKCLHGTEDDRQCARCDRNKNCRWNEDGDCRCDPH